METTIKKKVKGTLLEQLFDNCTLFSIRYYDTVNSIEESQYNPNKSYLFNIKIRHAEGTDAEDLFQDAIDAMKPATGMHKQIAQQIDQLKKYAAAIPGLSENQIFALKEYYGVRTLKDVYKKLQHEIDFGVLGVLSNKY